jgi:hypothetical protein
MPSARIAVGLSGPPETYGLNDITLRYICIHGARMDLHGLLAATCGQWTVKHVRSTRHPRRPRPYGLDIGQGTKA